MRLHGLLAFAIKVPLVVSNKFPYCSRLIASASGVLKRDFAIVNSVNYQQWGKNKKHRNVKLQLYFDSMADPQIEVVLAPLRASVKEQVVYRLSLRLDHVSCRIKFYI